MKKDAYRNGKIPGRRGYNINDVELVRLFNSGLEVLRIADGMNISQWTVLTHLKKLGLRRTQRHHVAKSDVFAIPVSGNCYWAGFLAADGFVLSGHNGVGIELSAIDIDHIKSLCRFVGRDESLWYRTRYKNGKIHEYAGVNLLSEQILEDLFRLFHIVPRKSLILEPPDLPKNLRRHFIRGYFDGDGSVGWHKHNKTVRLNFCSGSEKFLEWIWNTMCEELGGLGQRMIGRRKNSKVRTLDLSGDAAIKVFEWMYSDGGDVLCLKRKREKFLECQELLKIKRITCANKRQITIDNMVNLYAQGLSYSEIAKQLNTTKENVSYYLRQTSIQKRTKKTDSLVGQQLMKRDKEMLTAYENGEKAEDIARRFGIAKSSFWIAIRRAKEAPVVR